ncbi:Uncharacterised protein [Mycobacteroides abscessus subsp. abscessus]|nr:Uncharacterised protein [Mycobacteroides abscessus subsp. abscessus]SHS11807.1 Uncharacterised protein [Mycobacteroides abscessus subsp. abscessus]SHT22802.1 Uncharacterised protein [Mycobacteroides abscessus subsp. abscessus]SHW59127.1 Uncharacterised protein [Mycobacteroides abscessus subsp. abscessus]SIB53595.1 Uncharacterised protein [Mycobacteroides abscessus subsp. abscessus]
MSDNLTCACGHHRSDHNSTESNPFCKEGAWVTTAEVPRGDDFQIFEPCECIKFEGGTE